MVANWQVICPPPDPHSGARKRGSCYNASSWTKQLYYNTSRCTTRLVARARLQVGHTLA